MTHRDALDKAEQSIRKDDGWTADLEERFTDLREHDGDEQFWRSRLDGRALLATTDEVRLYSAARPIPERTGVAAIFRDRVGRAA